MQWQHFSTDLSKAAREQPEALTFALSYVVACLFGVVYVLCQIWSWLRSKRCK